MTDASAPQSGARPETSADGVPRLYAPRLANDVMFAAAVAGIVWLLSAAAAAIVTTVTLFPDGRIMETPRMHVAALWLRANLPWLALGPLLVLATLRITRLRAPIVVRMALHLGMALFCYFAIQRVMGGKTVPLRSTTALGKPRSVTIVNPAAAASNGFTRPPVTLLGGPTRSTSRDAVTIYLVLFALTMFAETWRRRALAQLLAGRAADHARALEEQLASAQLSALRMELHPHFLYNTLNLIAGLVDERPQTAKEMIARLGGLLRATLRVSTPTVTLAEELAWLEDYVELQQARFGDRLRVDILADGSTAGFRVPFLVLQPLVENAIVHGMQGGAGRLDGHIEIDATVEERRLRLTVADNGIGLVAPVSRGHGVGIANVRTRLAMLYGDGASVSVMPRATGGTVALVELPAES